MPENIVGIQLDPSLLPGLEQTLKLITGINEALGDMRDRAGEVPPNLGLGKSGLGGGSTPPGGAGGPVDFGETITKQNQAAAAFAAYKQSAIALSNEQLQALGNEVGGLMKLKATGSQVYEQLVQLSNAKVLTGFEQAGKAITRSLNLGEIKAGLSGFNESLVSQQGFFQRLVPMIGKYGQAMRSFGVDLLVVGGPLGQIGRKFLLVDAAARILRVAAEPLDRLFGGISNRSKEAAAAMAALNTSTLGFAAKLPAVGAAFMGFVATIRAGIASLITFVAKNPLLVLIGGLIGFIAGGELATHLAKSYGNLQQLALRSLQAANLPGTMTGQLVNQAIQQSLQSRIFGPQQILEATQELTKSGLSLQDAMGGVNEVLLEFATLGQQQVPAAATQLIRLYQQIGTITGNTAQDFRLLGDLIIRTANLSAFGSKDIAQVGQALSEIGYITKTQLNVDLPKLAAFFTTLTAQGLSPAEGATAMRELFTRLSRELLGGGRGFQQQQVISNLTGIQGIVGEFQRNRDPLKFLQALGKAIPPAQAPAALGQVLGEAGSRAARAFIQRPEQFDKALKDLNETWGKSIEGFSAGNKELDLMVRQLKEFSETLQGQQMLWESAKARFGATIGSMFSGFAGTWFSLKSSSLDAVTETVRYLIYIFGGLNIVIESLLVPVAGFLEGLKNLFSLIDMGIDKVLGWIPGVHALMKNFIQPVNFNTTQEYINRVKGTVDILNRAANPGAATSALLADQAKADAEQQAAQSLSQMIQKFSQARTAVGNFSEGMQAALTQLKDMPAVLDNLKMMPDKLKQALDDLSSGLAGTGKDYGKGIDVFANFTDTVFGSLRAYATLTDVLRLTTGGFRDLSREMYKALGIPRGFTRLGSSITGAPTASMPGLDRVNDLFQRSISATRLVTQEAFKSAVTGQPLDMNSLLNSLSGAGLYQVSSKGTMEDDVKARLRKMGYNIPGGDAAVTTADGKPISQATITFYQNFYGLGDPEDIARKVQDASQKAVEKSSAIMVQMQGTRREAGEWSHP